jgi:cobalt/nickel transport system permease protein
MRGNHGSVVGLHQRGTTYVHRLPAQARIVAATVCVVAVVATPRASFWAFGVHFSLVVTAAAAAKLSPRLIARRLRVEVPFLAFAVLLPFVGRPPRVDVAGLALSRPGLWAAWNVAAKGTLGVLIAIVVASTTAPADLVRGLERLRVPRVLTGITGFMIRYLDLIVRDAERMCIARLSRGYRPRWLGQARVVATSAGTLFIRTYERGERVHRAMLARGYAGTLPPADDDRSPSPVMLAAALPTLAVATMVLARVVS